MTGSGHLPQAMMMPFRHASRLPLAPLRGMGLDPRRARHQKAGKGKWDGVGLRPHPLREGRGNTPAGGLKPAERLAFCRL